MERSDPLIHLWSIQSITRSEWDVYWGNCSNTNLLQSWEYGEAKELAEKWVAKHFIIFNQQKKPVALIQVLIKSLPLLGGIARVNRGPILIGNTAKNHKTVVSIKMASLALLLKEARKQHWRLIQISPELPNTTIVKESLLKLGLKRQNQPVWASGRIDLNIDKQDMLRNFSTRWRRHIKKSIKLKVSIKIESNNIDNINLLLSKYNELQNKKEFTGISNKLINALSKQVGIYWKFNLFIAYDDTQGKPIGVLVSIHSGDTAIYLIGSTTEKGRKMQANSLLLWQSILHAKNSGCAWFDIGGLNESTPKGIATFKKGLNAIPYKLSGEWRKWTVW
jgi:lipid II:glycine glycyltransferase (peptidoglycan interpeptide bridge formation enzyme)